MEALTLVLFVGAVWVVGAVGFFAWNLRHDAPDHSDRLALLPVEDNWEDNWNDAHAKVDAPGETT